MYRNPRGPAIGYQASLRQRRWWAKMARCGRNFRNNYGGRFGDNLDRLDDGIPDNGDNNDDNDALDEGERELRQNVRREQAARLFQRLRRGVLGRRRANAAAAANAGNAIENDDNWIDDFLLQNEQDQAEINRQAAAEGQPIDLNRAFEELYQRYPRDEIRREIALGNQIAQAYTERRRQRTVEARARRRQYLDEKRQTRRDAAAAAAAAEAATAANPRRTNRPRRGRRLYNPSTGN